MVLEIYDYLIPSFTNSSAIRKCVYEQREHFVFFSLAL